MNSYTSLPDATLRNEARRLREIAGQLRETQPEHAASCVFAAAMIESMIADTTDERWLEVAAKRDCERP